MAKSTLTIGISISGLDATLRALRRLPAEASNELRVAAEKLSKELAISAAAAGRVEGRQAALVSTTVKARRDRVPVIVAGGTKRLGRNKKPAYKLLFGSEFGADRLRQYKPHLGTGSYWFFRTVDDEQAAIVARWQEAADEIIERFSEGA